MNTSTHIQKPYVQRYNRARFDPLREINPDTLSRQLTAFNAGYLREAAETWDAIERSDDLLKGVIAKRKKSVSRNGWEIVVSKHTPNAQRAEAERHKTALEHFYRNVRCTNAVDLNERGGFKLLIRQMMDATGKRYAVHEIIWNNSDANGLTAEFRFVPLSYFENTTGTLRFLDRDTSLEGQALAPGAWLVTAADGLMFASSIAWMIKKLALADWTLFSQHHGTPGIQGITNSAVGSDQWNQLDQNLRDLIDGSPFITNSVDAVKVIDLAQGAHIPFPALADRVDRMMAALWRGADLSTLSREHGYGASLQDREAALIEEDDCELISESLNQGVDRWVIRYLFGENVEPLARIRVLPAPRETSEYDLRVDQFLASIGAPLSLPDLMQRYSRELPEPGEPTIQSDALSPATRTTHANISVPSVLSVPSSDSTSLGIANTFTVLQDDWIQLSPIGDFPHSQGIQRVDRDAVNNIARQFNSLFGKLGRLFAGVPFYVGHPDVPSLAREFPDRKAYGWITHLEAREDGLAARVKWSAEGKTLLENAHYKFLSPYWEADEIARENGRAIFRPKRLLSVGLTNQPNIPVLPLANETERGWVEDQPQQPEIPAAPSETTGPATAQLCATASPLPGAEGEPSFSNHTLPLALHTTPLANDLGRRHSRRSCERARHTRVRDLVSEKMALGNSYDEAWSAIKQEHPALFALMTQPNS